MARLSATHKGAQTVSGPPQSPTRSLEGSGSQTDPLTPLVQRAARDHPFPIDIKTRIFGGDAPAVADTYQNLAALYQRQGNQALCSHWDAGNTARCTSVYYRQKKCSLRHTIYTLMCQDLITHKRSA